MIDDTSSTVGRPIRLLTFSTLYPNAEQPHHGVFVENRLRHLLASGAATSRVVAPVPWFPSSSRHFGSYAVNARISRAEERHGVSIDHPRYALPPKIGMVPAPLLMYWGARRAVERLRRNGYDFDVIDAHYFYPDGVAAALLAREFRRPLVITARGTDINLIPQYQAPRRMIQWAARQASHMITVCAALKTALCELDVPDEKVTVLRNGVDLKTFHPIDPAEARVRLGESPDGLLLASVGHLIERKGHHHVIGALPRLPQARVVIAGTGPEKAALDNLATRLGVADRVRFLGHVPHGELAQLYSAADTLVLASSREGWANVLLEAMACGTPVVASDIWGTPEVVAAPEAGRLMPELTAAGVARAVSDLLRDLPDRQATRRYAERFSWDDTTAGQIAIFEKLRQSAPRS
ncbi:MAG TPA: glycosyltransferase family 4 protein [Aliidongia sp.]|uniref:glycosyltransferase family 4 protein n=1 Tax=Aliidongia sp. TaxID=1914230 RepID=UPI002DDD98E1|nr:glycosyltransferase family 4 protein [Aliidongia sp.]HEV2673675.1 glycosyltransferase family 4 protein [Aliidongia sp.]